VRPQLVAERFELLESFIERHGCRDSTRHAAKLGATKGS
jgi:hypothetical protein